MDDLEFVQRCVKGDKLAWDEFVEKYSRLIYHYIRSTLKVKGSLLTQENIEELFQGLFLGLIKDNFRKLKSFKARNGCSLATWLRQVAVNYTLDYIRKSRPTLSLEEGSEAGWYKEELFIDGSGAMVEAIYDKERFGRLKECIDGLGNDDRYFLELHINKGLQLEDLKRHFKISRPAIDMRKMRIIERLRDCFRGKGFALDF